MKVRVLLTLAVLVVLATTWLVAGKMHRFAYWIARKDAAQVQALAKDGWLIDRLQVAPDVELVGLVRPPKSPDARWLLFVPGNSTAMLDGFQAVLDDLRGDDDVGLAFWGYRGFDASGGTPTPAALAADLRVQWQRLQELGATPARTEVWGYSLGSTLAPHLVAHMCDAGQAPQRMVLLATGMKIPVRPFGWFGRFQSSDVYEGISQQDRVTCPVIVAQGSADDAMPIDGAKQLAKAFGARMLVLEGRGHADLWTAARQELWGK